MNASLKEKKMGYNIAIKRVQGLKLFTYPGFEFRCYMNQHDKNARRGYQRAKLPQIRRRVTISLKYFRTTEKKQKSGIELHHPTWNF